MNNGWRAAALGATLSLALGVSCAVAQDIPPGCVSTGNPNGAAAGALLGGLAGALLGNAASGRRKAGGTILGGVAGAAAGAAIGGSAGGGIRCPDGYAYRAVPPPDDGGPIPVAREDFWYDAPTSLRERIIFLRHRIERLDRDGWLSPRETQGLSRKVSDIAHQEANIRDRNDGDLPPDARAQISDELADVAHHLRWKEYRSEHAQE
jgi:hypothetical protein